MTKTIKINTGFTPYLIVLGLVLTTLKVMGHVTWPWLWVLSPFWLPLIPAALMLVFACLLMLLAVMVATAVGIYEIFKR